jgi:hypothetical protein
MSTPARPFTTTTILAGGYVGLTGSTLKLRVERANLGVDALASYETGDGDTAAKVGLGEVRENIALQGHILSGALIGLASIGSNTAIPVELYLHSGLKVTFNAKIRALNIRYDKPAPNLPCSALLLVHGGRIAEALVP